MSSSSRYVRTADGFDIAYGMHGSGPHFVFIRGWVSHLDLMWQNAPFRRFFAPIVEDYTLVRYDTRGNGLSTRKFTSVSLDDLVLDLEAVATQVAEEPFVLFSHGLATPIAIRFAAQHPERVSHLILDGPFSQGSALAPPYMRRAFRALLPVLTRAPESVFYMLAHLTHPEPGANHDRAVDFGRKSIDARAAQLLYALALEVDVTAELAQITAPTLVLHRESCKAVPFELGQHVAAGIPGAEFVALHGSAQNPWDGDADETIRSIGEFLGHAWRLPPPEDAGAPVRIVLFTDLEDHTPMMSRLGDRRGRAILREHEALTRQALKTFDGVEVKAMGDGFMAWFSSATSALECAATLQRDFAARNETSSEPIAIRVGLNAGEPVEDERDLFGSSVIMAARIASQAAGGEIYVADVVKQLVAGKDFLFSDRGEQVLRGFEDPVHVFELSWRDSSGMDVDSAR